MLMPIRRYGYFLMAGVGIVCFLLGAYHGRVAVFSYDRDGNMQLKQITELKIDDLPPHWAQDIKLGRIKVDTEEQLGQVLDSLDECRRDQ